MNPTKKPPTRITKTVQARSAGGLVVAIIEGQPKILLIKNTFDHQWAIPKGHIDPGETSEQAAVREIQEEAGVNSKIIEKIGQNRYSFRHGTILVRKSVDVYLLELVGEPTLDPTKFDPHDKLVRDVKWFDPAKAADTIGYKNLRELVEKGAQRAVELYG